MQHHFASSPPYVNENFPKGRGHPLTLHPFPRMVISVICQIKDKHPDENFDLQRMLVV